MGEEIMSTVQIIYLALVFLAVFVVMAGDSESIQSTSVTRAIAAIG